MTKDFLGNVTKLRNVNVTKYRLFEDAIFEAWQNGLSLRAIAAAADMSHSQVKRVVDSVQSR